MKDAQTIARPYAKALFELALKHHSMSEWSDVLQVLAIAISDRQMQLMLNHPEVTPAMLIDLLSALLTQTNLSVPNLDLLKSALELMASQHRLPVIPEISRQFEQLKAQHAKTCSAVVYSATKLDEQQLNRLATGLGRKLQKSVTISQVVQPELLGGAKVQIGDMVIDGTIRGRLQRLSQSLLAAS